MKRFISLLFIAYVAMGSTFAYDFQSGDLYYNIYSNYAPYYTVAVTYQSSDPSSNYSELTTANIPETVTYDGKTYAVTSVGNSAFYGCSSLTSVSIPNSVTSIEYEAFYGCSGLTKTNYTGNIAGWCSIIHYDSINPISYSHNLYINDVEIKDLVIPDGTTAINNFAFSGCTGLTSVTIPNSVTSIGDEAFSGCTGLTSLTIPESVTSIGSGAFQGCTDLTSVTIPNSVTNIGSSAFAGCSGLTSVTIPNSVTSIGDRTFSGCSGLTSVTIPNSVTSIGDRTFSGCSGLTTIVWNAKNYGWGVISADNLFYGVYSNITSFTFGNEVETIPSDLCKDMSGLTSVTIPESVTSIGDYTFNGCTGLTSITIPESVTNIGISAFSGCSGLTSITIPNGVTSIEHYTFSGCSGLTSITIPNSVTSIGEDAFDGCTGLTKTNYTGDIAGWCNIDFGNGYANPVQYSHNLYINDVEVKDLVIPDGITAIKNYAFCMCKGLTSLAIGNSVTSIGDYTFNGCTGLTSVTIPNNVTSIGNSAFSGCSGLTSVTIPNSVTSIGEDAFSGCSGLTSVTIGNGVTNIGESAFAYCSSLASVTIGNSVTSIGRNAFSFCSRLTSVTIPNSVTSIGFSAFYNVTNIVYNGTASANYPWGAKSINGYVDGYLVYESAAKTKLKGCSSAATGAISIPYSVTGIGERAFEDCISLTSITIPNRVTYIQSSAFANCTGLTSLTIPNSVTSIGTSAFNNVNNIVYSGTATGSPWGAKSVNGYIDGYLIYESAAKTQLLGCYPDAIGEIVIPNTVTSIGDRAFMGCSGITSVTIPNSVTSIGWGAFSGCNSLAAIIWNAKNCNNWTSYEKAPFYNIRNTITSFTIGEDVESIPNYLCYGMQNLTSVVWNSTVVPAAGDSLFYGCLNGVSFTVGDKVESIPAYLCSNMSNIISITISENVTSIGKNAFQGCTSLTSVVWNAKDCKGWDAYNSPFHDYNSSIREGIKSFIFGDKVEKIPAYLCYGMSNITSVTIPNSITSIEDGAFRACSGLTSITIPNSVTSIGEDAFSGCSGLTSVTIGNGVTNIGDYAFVNCDSLTKINYTGDIADWCNINFDWKANPVEYSHNLYINDVEVKDLVIPEGITAIHNYAFYGCTGLTSVTIPESITSIGENTFSGCTGLASITIPNNVTSIGRGSFSDCRGLTFVIWNAKNCSGLVSDYYYSPFSGCTNVQNFTFGNEVETIPDKLCSGMSTLTSITIPNSVTSIGDYAFRDCTGLTSVIWNAKDCSGWEAKSSLPFSGCTNVQNFTFGNEVETIPEYLCYKISSLTSVTISNSVTSIGISAFDGCSGLTSITIPNSVTSIGISAFGGCSGLTSITIPNSVTSIGNSAFGGCSGLTSITCEAITPPKCDYTSFSGFSTDIPVYIPCGTTNAYRQSIFWAFTNLQEPPMAYSITVLPDNKYNGEVRVQNITQDTNCEITAVFSAIPYGLFAFRQWSDGNTDNPRTIVLTQDTVIYAQFIRSYTITTSCNSWQGTVTGDGTYDEGTEITLTATPNNGYRFTQWSDGNTDNPRVVTVNADATYYTALFEEIYYTINTTCDATQGTITGGGQYTIGNLITLVATPNTGYEFIQWSDGNTENPRVVTVSEDATYEALFEKVYFTVTTNCNAAQGTVTTGGTFYKGTSVTLTATANTGYRFSQWSDGNTDNPRVLTVDRDTTCTALFESVFYTLTATCEPAQGAVTGGGTFQEGTTVTLTATPNDGYRFGQWSDGNTDNPRTVTVTEDKTYTAEFIKLCIITADCDAAQGTVTGDRTYDEGTTVTLTATPNDGYRFGQWSDGNTDNPRTVTATEDKTYTAEFVKLCIITVDCDAAQGIVTGSGTYDEGKTITLTATPNDGYRFGQWNDGNTDNPRTVTATEDKNYTAEFVKLCIITADCDAAQGTVTGGGTYDEGTTVTLTATPNKGYVFARWDDNNTDNPRSVVVLADAAYTAFFDEEQTALDQVGADGTAAQKIIRNGQVLIQRGDKLYTLTGQEIIKH